ncbi:MAG: cell division protein FtsL [Terriglobales bacterium]
MAAGATTRPQVWASRRGWNGTPEVYFTKAIDNSRLVRVADPKRSREMTQFACALALLFLLVMIYAWQHFSAIEYGYRIEAMKSQRDTMVETNRALRLEEASLRDPQRIDMLAREMGLQTPKAGQVVLIEPSAKDPGVPVMARADVAVISTP